MTKIWRVISALYTTTALCGAITLSYCTSDFVYAQTQTPTESYSVQSRMDQIERHIDTTDSRVNDLSDKVSLIQGVGTGILGLLGALQLLGLITAAKASKE